MPHKILFEKVDDRDQNYKQKILGGLLLDFFLLILKFNYELFIKKKFNPKK